MTVFVILALVGIALALWLIPGIDATIRKLLIAVAVVLVILWALYVFGLLPYGDVRVPRYEGP